jgi:hypothetical protein
MNFKLIVVMGCLLMAVSMEQPDSKGYLGKGY